MCRCASRVSHRIYTCALAISVETASGRSLQYYIMIIIIIIISYRKRFSHTRLGARSVASVAARSTYYKSRAATFLWAPTTGGEGIAGDVGGGGEGTMSLNATSPGARKVTSTPPHWFRSYKQIYVFRWMSCHVYVVCSKRRVRVRLDRWVQVIMSRSPRFSFGRNVRHSRGRNRMVNSRF